MGALRLLRALTNCTRAYLTHVILCREKGLVWSVITTILVWRIVTCVQGSVTPKSREQSDEKMTCEHTVYVYNPIDCSDSSFAATNSSLVELTILTNATLTVHSSDPY